MDKEKTKVIFRMFGDGQVIAFFPEIATDTKGYYCQSYMHVGQHSAANPGLTNQTTPASEEDYQGLFDELTKIGYNLEVIKRFRYSHYETRKQTYK